MHGNLGPLERMPGLNAFYGRSRLSRNHPDLYGHSRLSPHLHFGEITRRQVWAAVRRLAERSAVHDWRSCQFLTELGWREFSHHLLYHFPLTPTEPLRSEFKEFPWRGDQLRLKVWCAGRTGFPFVDGRIIDENHACVDLACEALAVFDVLRVDRAAESIWGVVCDCNRLRKRRGLTAMCCASVCGRACLAKKKGKALGRPTLAQAKTDKIQQLYAEGMVKNQIAQRLNIGRASVFRALSR